MTTKRIEDLRPGERVRIEGRVYMRLRDYPAYHVEDFLVDLETGWIGPWSRLVRWPATVEVIEKETP